MYIITERPTDWIGYLVCVKEAETSTNEKKEIEMEKEKGSKQAIPYTQPIGSPLQVGRESNTSG